MHRVRCVDSLLPLPAVVIVLTAAKHTCPSDVVLSCGSMLSAAAPHRRPAEVVDGGHVLPLSPSLW